MPNVLGFLRHHCGDGVGQFVVLGNVDRKGETVGWGMMLPGGPDPSQFGWSYCPWCAEELPQFVKDWQASSDPTAKAWSPFGIKESS